MTKRPELSDYYDSSDPRGCSSSEYREYESAVIKWEKDRIASSDDIPAEEGVDEESSYNPYCEICTGCGEEGCCSPMACSQDENGKYCGGYLNDLKFGYLMYKDMYELICEFEDERLDAKVNKLYDEKYDIVYGKYEDDNIECSSKKERN